VLQWFARWTSDLKVGGSTPSPCHRVVSLDKKLYPTLSLSTQVYKMGTGDILLGVTLRWTGIPSKGNKSFPLFSARKWLSIMAYTYDAFLTENVGSNHAVFL